MIQIEIFDSKWTANSWLGEHSDQYAIRDIKPITGEHAYDYKLMVIYEDHSKEIEEALKRLKSTPIQVLPDHNSTSGNPYDDYAIYLNG